MCIVRYPLRFAGILCTLLGLLVFAPIIYFVGGAIGTYFLLFPRGFGDHANTTSAIDHAIDIIKTAYTAHEAPTTFHQWGVGFLIAYIVVIVLVGSILCCRTMYQCGRELHELGGESPSDRDIEMTSSLRKDYEQRQASQL